ncbi:hypothetical protein [Nocardia brasiliensis]|uniref:hypothetical protein n=1 Tax=Nocardia brasiliensis TaxID=37326 RepID=UPI00366D1220
MVGPGIVQRMLVLAAVGLVGSACGGSVERLTQTPSPSETTSVPAPNSEPGTPPPGSPPPLGNQPPNDQPPPGDQPQGTATIRTRTLNGAPVPNVPVSLRLQQPCDPATNTLPPGTTEVLRRDVVTDRDGSVTLTVPLGCYSFGTDNPPAGRTPFPNGMQGLFLKYAAHPRTGELRFAEPGPQPPCAVQTVVLELDRRNDLYDHLRNTNAEVSECDGQWAHAVWDAPGDNARIIRRDADGWTTYISFPHNVCWAKAAGDGVPARMKEYFIHQKC